MKRRIVIAAVAITVLTPTWAWAQEESPLISAIYYVCDQTRQEEADDVIRDVLRPMFESHMPMGHITAWGMIGHHAGGHWRRAVYFVSPNLGALMDARNAVVEEFLGEHRAAADQLQSVCHTHDDYIWEHVASSVPAEDIVTDRPTAGFSMYAQCDMAQERRADELVQTAFAPVFDRHIGEGALSTWSWWAHHTGGKYRRLLVMDGADHKTVMLTREAIVNDLRAEAPEALSEFDAICGSHTDYNWNIMMSSAGGE
jgi:hypothetical protein